MAGWLLFTALTAFGVGLSLGVALGFVAAARNAHRLVARLPEPERVAFARKVHAAARR